MSDGQVVITKLRDQHRGQIALSALETQTLEVMRRGVSQAEAARELGITIFALRGRLDRIRDKGVRV